MTALSDGRFVVAWNGYSARGQEVVARVFQPDGTPIGRQFVVSEHVDRPSLTSLSDGGFAVAYPTDFFEDNEIRTQVFGPSLARIGDETTVNTSAMKFSSSASLVSLQDKYMAFFLDYTDDNRIIGRILNNDGSTPSNATDFVVATGEEHDSKPVAAKLSDGRVVAAWVKHRDAGTPFDAYAVVAQILNADGTKSGDELALSVPELDDCYAPVIAASAEGGFTLAYMKQHGNSASIRVAAFDKNGMRMGEDLLIEKFSTGQLYNITSLADGRVVVTWIKHLKGKNAYDSYAQIVDPRQKAVDLAGTSSKDQYFGTRFDDKLAGAEGRDLLSGEAGRDTIHGGVGNDKLYGGRGQDVFVFDTTPNKTTNVDRIVDFNPKYDAIWLDDSVFAGLGDGTISTPVKFKSDMFVKGTKAKDRQDRIIYDSETGALYYDQDGTGSKAKVKIAILPANLKLTYNDFFAV